MPTHWLESFIHIHQKLSNFMKPLWPAKSKDVRVLVLKIKLNSEGTRLLVFKEEQWKPFLWFYNRRWAILRKILPLTFSESWVNHSLFVETVNTCQLFGWAARQLEVERASAFAEVESMPRWNKVQYKFNGLHRRNAKASILYVRFIRDTTFFSEDLSTKFLLIIFL